MANPVEMNYVEHVAGTSSTEINQVLVVSGLGKGLGVSWAQGRVLVVAGLNLIANKPRHEHSRFI